MSKLSNFKDLKFTMDHAFFKSIILPRAQAKNAVEPVFEGYE